MLVVALLGSFAWPVVGAGLLGRATYVVDGAGLEKVNGRYIEDGIHQDAAKFRRLPVGSSQITISSERQFRKRLWFIGDTTNSDQQ